MPETTCLFSEDENRVVGNLVQALDDVGITTMLISCVLADKGNSEAAAEAFSESQKEVEETYDPLDPEAMVDCAASLKVVVDVAARTGYFPADFLPTPDYMVRVKAAQFAAMRQEAQKTKAASA